MKKFAALVAFIAVLFVTDSIAQKTDSQKETPVYPTNFGIYGGTNFNLYPNTEIGLRDTGGNLQYKGTTTMRWNFGGEFNYPLTNTIFLTGRIGYNSMGAIDWESDPYFDAVENDDFYIKHDLNTGYIELSPLVKLYELIPVENLYLLGGLEVGFQVPGLEQTVTRKFNNSDITEPSTTAVDTNINQSDVENANMRLALAIGAGYTYALNKTTFLSPELSFRFPFNSVASQPDAGEFFFDEFNVPQVRLGLSLTFSLDPKEEDEMPKDDDYINVGFQSIRYYDKEGNTRALRNIAVEEVQYTELFPLIPYIFYEEGTAEPRKNTQTLSAGVETGEFQIAKLEPDAIGINNSTIDIIGRRMQENESSELTIIGTLDNKDEKGNVDLALDRANFVKDYLVMNYSVDPFRINVETRMSPVNPSSDRVPEGIAENRRAELKSDDELLSPILIKDEMQRIPEPSMIEFVPFVESSQPVKNWKMEISQSDRLIRTYEGEDRPTNIQWNIVPNELDAGSVPVDYLFTAETVNGADDISTGSIPVEFISITKKKSEDRADKVISKYSLNLFPFNSSDISGKDKSILDENVIPEISAGSTVQIYGYTDKIGDANYNKKLAMERAESVKKYLASKAKDAKYEVFGVGESVELFDNSTPIGRHLSRTVQIYVITPKN